MALVPNPYWLTLHNETCTILKISYSITVTSHFVCISAICPQEAAERTNTTYVNNANYSKRKCLNIESNLITIDDFIYFYFFIWEAVIYPYVYNLPILEIWIELIIGELQQWQIAKYSKVSHFNNIHPWRLTHHHYEQHITIILIKSNYTPYCV